MATGFSRGHKIVYNYEIQEWVYADDGTPIDEAYPRQCVRCGKFPNPDGSDACIGHVDGAVSVCCGHGVTIPILIKES